MPTEVSTMITLDRERTLRFDYDAIDWITELPPARRANRPPLQLWADANGFDTGAMSILICAAARHEDRELTIDQVRKALRSTLKMRRTTYKAINDALNASINQSDMLGLFQPTADDEGASDDAAEGPTRAAAASMTAALPRVPTTTSTGTTGTDA